MDFYVLPIVTATDVPPTATATLLPTETATPEPTATATAEGSGYNDSAGILAKIVPSVVNVPSQSAPGTCHLTPST